MKKLIILTALALPLVFAGCSNEEDFDFAQQKPSQETNTDVVGKIASHGMTVAVGNGADTRLSANGWEKGDRLGIAWVVAKEAKVSIKDAIGFDNETAEDSDVSTAPHAKYTAAGTKLTFNGEEIVAPTVTGAAFIDAKYYPVRFRTDAENMYCVDPSADPLVWNYVTPIFATQYPVDFTDFASLTDSKIYANNMFEFNGNGFGYYGDIYEGAYFAYWPYAKLAGVKEMAIELNNKQTIASSEKFYLNNAFSISAIDTINARGADGEFVTKSGTSKAFDLVKVANGISVNTAFVGTEDVTDMKIVNVTVSASAKELFATTATFNPHKLPVAEYKDDKITYDAEETLKAMKAADALIGGFGTTDKPIIMPETLATSISTEVEMDLKAANTISLLTFPTAAPSSAVTTAEVTIEVEVENKGKFTIAYDAEAKDANAIENNKALLKLVQLLNGTYADGGKTHSLQNLNTTYFNIPVKLMMSDFALTDDWEVKVATDWNKAVTEIDALGIKNAKIKLVNDITVENPLFPTNAELTVTGDAKKDLTIKGSATINKNVKTETISAMGYKLAKGSELTIPKDVVVEASTIIVDGILNVDGEIKSDAITGNDAITINENQSVDGVLNLGANGKISDDVTIANEGVINVTESKTNAIAESITGAGKVIAVITDGANAANILAIETAGDFEVTFNGATIDVKDLTKDAVYFTKGNTTFKGTGSTIDTKLTVSEGTLTFIKGATLTLGTATGSNALTVAKDAKMVIATGTASDDGTTATLKTHLVVNNGTIELLKDSKDKKTVWATGDVKGGTVILNDNERVAIP